MYYSVNVGPAHFLMLNSYISFQNGSAQFAFVEQDLAAYAAANQRYDNGSSSGLTPYVTFMYCIVHTGDLHHASQCGFDTCWCSDGGHQ